MSDSDAFAAWFQRELRRREWNQADAARRLGVSSSVVNRWFRGERLPDPRSCDTISDVFSVSIDQVLELAGHRPPMAPRDPSSPVPALQALVDRVTWTPERAATVDMILRGWIDRDRGNERGS
jgi:transcriptional regulator with XRE-family HTH domain